MQTFISEHFLFIEISHQITFLFSYHHSAILMPGNVFYWSLDFASASPLISLLYLQNRYGPELFILMASLSLSPVHMSINIFSKLNILDICSKVLVEMRLESWW